MSDGEFSFGALKQMVNDRDFGTRRRSSRWRSPPTTYTASWTYLAVVAPFISMVSIFGFIIANAITNRFTLARRTTGRRDRRNRKRGVTEAGTVSGTVRGPSTASPHRRADTR